MRHQMAAPQPTSYISPERKLPRYFTPSSTEKKTFPIFCNLILLTPGPNCCTNPSLPKRKVDIGGDIEGRWAAGLATVNRG